MHYISHSIPSPPLHPHPCTCTHTPPQSCNPLPLFLPVSLHLPPSKNHQSASECSSSNNRDFIRWWRKILMSDLSWPWWRWTARWCWVRTDRPCSWPWRGTRTLCPPSGPPQCPWCLESWSPRPGGHSKTTVNIVSQACHQWPWCLESWFPQPGGRSKTTVNTVSQACHQWPWCLESWSPRPGGHKTTNGQHLTVMLWAITLGDMVVWRSGVNALVDTVRYQKLNIVQSGH